MQLLTKNHEELQESHAVLRQDMLNLRKSEMDNRLSSQKTLIGEAPDISALQRQVEELTQQNLNLNRTSEQQIQLLKLKMNQQRSEYSARMYELEQKLRGIID